MSFTTSLVDPDRSIKSIRSKGACRRFKLDDALFLTILEQFEISLAQAEQSTIGAAIDDADVESHQLRIDTYHVAFGDLVAGHWSGRVFQREILELLCRRVRVVWEWSSSARHCRSISQQYLAGLRSEYRFSCRHSRGVFEMVGFPSWVLPSSNDLMVPCEERAVMSTSAGTLILR